MIFEGDFLIAESRSYKLTLWGYKLFRFHWYNFLPMFLLSPQRSRGKQEKKSYSAQTKNNGNSCYARNSYYNVRYISICKTRTFCIMTASQRFFVCLFAPVCIWSKQGGWPYTHRIMAWSFNSRCPDLHWMPFSSKFSLFDKWRWHYLSR